MVGALVEKVWFRWVGNLLYRDVLRSSRVTCCVAYAAVVVDSCLADHVGWFGDGNVRERHQPHPWLG